MDAAKALRAALDGAHGLLADGDSAEAERRAKAISALVKAERELAEFAAAPAAPPPEENDAAMRAELRRRLARFVEADLADAPAEVLERIALTGRAE